MPKDRVEGILDAAYVCFTRHGVQRTTMDDIAKEAGMSRSAVYQYVRNKEEAFRRLAERLFGAAVAQARNGLDTDSELPGRLTAALTAKLDLAQRVWRDSPHAGELLGESAHLSADLASSYNTAMRDLLIDAISVDHPDTEAAEVAELLLALTRGLEADLSHPDIALDRLRRGVTLVVAGLRTSTHAKLEETR